ncbi:hypothetical protein [Methylomonas sp. AM2-LC]|uniref:hypothetical protein n=1 Tax=Methylomonas sp. AM2-LC TaxID=3153301 RepID=UPI0032676EBB
MVDFDRIYFNEKIRSGLQEWFFVSREGLMGPYASFEDAVLNMQEFIKAKLQTRNSGGRSFGKLDLLGEDELPFIFAKKISSPQNKRF